MPSQISTPSIEPVMLGGKRKRDHLDHTSPTLNGIVLNHNEPEQTHISATTIKDICEALKRYDTTPSVLEHSLDKSTSSKEGAERASKRAKLSNSSKNADTILQKVDQDGYRSLYEFLNDVEEAATQVQASTSAQQNETNVSQWKYQPDSLDADRVSAQLKAFKKALRTFVGQEHAPSDTPATSEKNEKDIPNGHIKSEDAASSRASEDMADGQGKAVLTLFGNAQGQHKQLFSSFQKPMPRHLWSETRPSPDNAADVLMPLRENGLLGNQIISTKLVPTEGQDVLPAAKASIKFHDLFSPPSSLPALAPPKPTMSSTSRGANITWTSDQASAEPSQKHGYTTEKLPTGQWLGYDGVSMEQEATSPEAKRRRRDRALSSGEATREQPQQMKAALARAKEDALFRRVYSSFAPTIDNSSSVVPEETRNDMWWAQLVGNQQDPSVLVDPNLESNEIADAGTDALDTHPDTFKDVVENFEPIDLDNSSQGSSNNPQKILVDISELLETLQSHQRIRNSNLNSSARMGISSATSQHTRSTPDEAEVSIYNKSRTKLADLVSRLPPYTVAKVGGNELGDLILSREILLEGNNYQGTMDDDQTTRLAAAAALSSALGSSSASRNPTTTNRQNSYSYGRSNSNQVTPGTPSSAMRTGTNATKAPLSSWQTPAQSYASSTQRPAYNQLNNYGRAPLNSYTNTRPLTAQQPNGISTGYQQTPSQPMYQQRAQNATGQYSGYAQSPTVARPSSSMQGGYQPIMSRPPSNGYSSSTAGAPQAPMANTPLQPRPATQSSAQSPLPQGSPYAPPAANVEVNGTSQTSRPITPSTPAIAQAQQAQQPRQSPTIAPASSQAMTTSSSNGTPAP